MADVLVERALYEKPGAPHFYVRVRVVDRTGADLGASTADYFGVVYPNQWGASATPHRQVIDEARLPQAPLDAAALARLLDEHRRGSTARVPAHRSFEYYRDFNASSRADVDAQARGNRYVIVAMDGRLDVTDGAAGERIQLAADDDAAREVTIDVPVRWGVVPTGAVVLSDR
jgi:hypothetical protein